MFSTDDVGLCGGDLFTDGLKTARLGLRSEQVGSGGHVLDFLTNRLGAFFGAVGILTFADAAIDFHHYVGDWIQIWTSITRPVWDFLLGWVFDYFGMSVPWWVKDYLTMGVITFGMSLRTMTSSEGGDTLADLFRPKRLVSFNWSLSDTFQNSPLLWALLWPTVWAYAVYYIIWSEFVDGDLKAIATFFESFAYALLVIASSYALIFYGIG